MTEDSEHLRLLAIFHYVVGGLSALCACFPFIHLALGIGMVSGLMPMKPGEEFPARAVGWLFIILASTFILVGWAYAIGLMVAGRRLQRRRSYTYCLVMAGLSCMNMPFGTCLGIFTLIVLNRPSVKSLFLEEKARMDASEMDFA